MLRRSLGTAVLRRPSWALHATVWPCNVASAPASMLVPQSEDVSVLVCRYMLSDDSLCFHSMCVAWPSIRHHAMRVCTLFTVSWPCCVAQVSVPPMCAVAGWELGLALRELVRGSSTYYICAPCRCGNELPVTVHAPCGIT